MAKFLILSIVITIIQFVLVRSCGPRDRRDSLHITNDLVPLLNPYAFAELPITFEEAQKAGYKEMVKNTNYKGSRFIRHKEPSNILIFSEKPPRKLVGFQAQFPVSGIKIQTNWTRWFDRQSTITVEERDGDKFYTITTYFIKPDLIDTDEPNNCEELLCELYFQNGPTADSVMEAPFRKDQIKSPWVDGKCVPTMGHHYWINMSKNVDCMDIPPVFILHIDDKLNAFGINMFSNFNNSRQYEHPARLPEVFFYEYPDCLLQIYDEIGGLTSLHVYFNDNPDKYLCI